MEIRAGTRIGSYAVIDSLGAGGMGHVYRANDTRLGRDVAIKSLPGDLARNPAALTRFEREARFLASLNHPNIATIYGIEEAGDERFLILELVAGETLDTIIQRGPIPVDRAVPIAIEIASALEAAHEAGIIHRDLKPANVGITPDGRVKLLDFGIAKHLAPGAESTGFGQPSAITVAGSVVGTPQYMSPEQLLGDDVDRRTDVWAFGCLLYEMLTGKIAFNAPNFVALADVIRNEDPDWRALPRQVPEGLALLLARTLKKERRDRLHDIGDARLELMEIDARLRGATGGLTSLGRGAAARTRARGMLVGVAALAAVVIVIAGVVLGVGRGRGARDNIAAGGGGIGAAGPTLTQLTFESGVEQFPAWAPDGAAIVFAGDMGPVRKLFLRRIGDAEARQITQGAFDDLQPAFAGEGRIVFTRGREPGRRVEPGDIFSSYETNADVWMLDVASGRETRLVERAFYPAVSPDGQTIAVDASWAGPRRIWIVDARGINPRQVTSDSSEAVSHIQPRWAPDGTKLVYQRIDGTKFDIAVVDIASRASRFVTDDNYRDVSPAWGSGGIYYSSDRGGGGINVWRVPVGADGRPTAAPQQLTRGAGQDVQIAVAPNGTRLVYATLRQNADLWRLPVTPAGALRAGGTPEPLVQTTTEDSRGAWSPDGARIAFSSDRGGDMNVWVRDLAGGTARQVTTGAGGDFQPTWSPDGRTLVFFSSRAGNPDIWSVDVASGALKQLTSGHSQDVNPFWSPDGRQIAYQSDASGRIELWIMNADGSAPRQLTSIGVSGHFHRWRPDGHVYFRNPAAGALMRVPATGGEPTIVSRDVGAHLSFSPDGTRWIDVVGHKVLWLYSLTAPPQRLFAFEDPASRIDYPTWSPDGQWLVFDRFRPEGGDIWLAEGIR